MTHILVQHKAKDFKKWKPLFDEDGTSRKAKGSKGAQVFQDAENPNHITVLMEWKDLESAQTFVQSDDLREVMGKAGVVGQPEVHFLKRAATQSS